MSHLLGVVSDLVGPEESMDSKLFREREKLFFYLFVLSLLLGIWWKVLISSRVLVVTEGRLVGRVTATGRRVCFLSFLFLFAFFSSIEASRERLRDGGGCTKSVCVVCWVFFFFFRCF